MAALPSDAENLYTVLSAKTLNPNVRAIALSMEALRKVEHPKLLAALADRVRDEATDNWDDTVAVDDDMDRSFLAQSIDDAVQRLSPGARTVFVLHDVEGYTHEEIAQELGITAGGSKSQLFKARAKLRRLLAHLVDAPNDHPAKDSEDNVASFS